MVTDRRFDSNDKFVFVPNLSSGNVYAYKIASSGALTLIKGSPFAAIVADTGSIGRSVGLGLDAFALRLLVRSSARYGSRGLFGAIVLYLC